MDKSEMMDKAKSFAKHRLGQRCKGEPASKQQIKKYEIERAAIRAFVDHITESS